MKLYKAIFLVLVMTVGVCSAQTVTPPAPTTINMPTPTLSSAEPVELTTHETISLSTGNIGFFLPVVSLPQRNGSSLTLGFVLDGNTYSMREPHNMFTSMPNSKGDLAPTQTTIQNAPSLNTMLWPQPIHTNLPTLTADLSYAGLDSYNYCSPPEGTCPQNDNTFVNWPEYCMQNWTFTDWDGSSHPFNGTRDCSEVTMLNTPTGDSYWAFNESLPLKKQTSQSVDDSYYLLDATSTSDIRVIKRDGTVYHFSGYPSTSYVGLFGGPQTPPSTDLTQLNRYSAFVSSVIDPNGNTISYAGGVITDTIGRKINVYTTSIGYTAMNGQSTQAVTATATKQTATSTASWPVSYPVSQVPGVNGACRVNYVVPVGQGISAPNLIYWGPEGTSNIAAPNTYTITLQNGRAYNLTFDVTGNLTKITYPTGGYTKYDYLYGGGGAIQTENFSDVTCEVQPDLLLARHECTASGGCASAPTVTTVGSCAAGWPVGGEATTCYSGILGTLQPGGTSTATSADSPATVIDPYGNKSVHSFLGNFTYSTGGAGATGLSYHVGYYSTGDTYYVGQSTLLKGVVKNPSNAITGCATGGSPWNLQPCSVTTTYYDTSPAVSSVTQYTYDTTGYPNVTQIQSYDFSNNLVKTTTANWEHGGIYQSGAAGAATLSNVLDHVQSITNTDAVSGYTNTKSFTYDSLGNLQKSMLTGTNLTAMSTLYTPLDAYGRPTQVTDPNGNVTKYSFTDSNGWFDSTCAPSSDSQAYVTSVTNAKLQITNYKYNSCTGELGSVADPNGNVTKFAYDEMGRTLAISYPDGGSESGYYVDTLPNSIQVTKLATPNPSVVSTTLLDGFGRKIQTQVSDPTAPDYVDTTYDALGRVSSVSNPYRLSVPSSTNGVTQFGYDAIGRKTYELESDGTSAQYWCYDGTADPAHPQPNCHGNGSSVTGVTWVDHRDEVGNNWQHVSDGVGRLRAVIEPYAYETDYIYDGFSDLKQVDQWGGAHGSSTDHQRLFSYDSISRLISATNPETGTIGYGYDADSNIITKTDARNTKITYAYDPLNRLLSKSYSGDSNATPWSCYQYDGATSANQVGRLVSEWTQRASVGVCAAVAPPAGFLTKRTFALYDPMGRIKNELQYTPANVASGTPYKPAYTYDLLGNLYTSSDGTTPSPTTPGATLTFTFTRDSTPHLLTATSNWSDATHSASIFSAQTGQTPSPCGNNSSTAPYAAFGGLINAKYGSGLSQNRGYDPRLRMNCEIDGGSNAAATSGTASPIITGLEQTKP